MTTGALVTRSIHPTSRVALLGATVVFAAGLAVGAGGMRVASGSATAHAAMPASVRTFAVTPTLDTSKPYLTVQHGIVVPPQR